MAQKDVGNKVPIYKLKKTDEVMKYYDEWGEGNKYDKDMVDWNYTGPKETAEVFIKHEKNKDTKIYDAWHSPKMNEIRELHKNGKFYENKTCKDCVNLIYPPKEKDHPIKKNLLNDKLANSFQN